jgi:SAM-dependent methyltransferase
MTGDAQASGGDVRRRHWNTVARHWRHLGPPLRPCDEDLRIMADAVARRRSTGEVPAPTLLLGVTPELAAMPWPGGAMLVAVERSEQMVSLVWPGDVPGRRHAVSANWLRLPLPDAAFAVAVGDGSYCNVDYPDGFDALNAGVRRVLMPGGVFVMRFWVRPVQRETPADVWADLDSGAIGSFHVFKFRLAMAMHPDAGPGVRLADVYQAWADARIGPADLARRTGWPIDAINTIELYRDKQAHLSFPTLPQLKATIDPHFQVIEYTVPQYELGDRSPILVLRKR